VAEGLSGHMRKAGDAGLFDGVKVVDEIQFSILEYTDDSITTRNLCFYDRHSTTVLLEPL